MRISTPEAKGAQTESDAAATERPTKAGVNAVCAVAFDAAGELFEVVDMVVWRSGASRRTRGVPRFLKTVGAGHGHGARPPARCARDEAVVRDVLPASSLYTMPYLTIGARRHAIEIGETTIGGADATIGIPGAPDGEALVTVLRMPDGRVSLRRLRADAAVLVDGEPLADAPRALEHGTKLEIHGRTIFYGDARRSAGTEGVSGVTDEQLSPLDAALPPAPASDTGGRLVSVATGREWPVPDEGLEIGRDPACDVVVASSDASRWHATIERTLLGYAVRDTSSNGIRVNGARVEQSRLLARGDVLRVGGEEFRFEADEPTLGLEHPAPSEAESLSAAPATRPRSAASPPLLATIEIVNEGARKGERIRIERTPVRIGRSSRADVVFSDDSVSSMHATLERRDGAWSIVDHDSRNGSYVDGERFRGTRQLTGPSELRFGNVKLLFRPIAAASITAPPAESGPAAPTGDTAGTRGIVGVGGDES